MNCNVSPIGYPDESNTLYRTRGSWATSPTLRKQLKSLNTYDYIITFIKRRKNPLFA